MTLRRLVLWRHGESELNAARRMQGQLDCGLTAEGGHQAQRSAAALAALEPEVLVTSDLRRAAATAAELAELTGEPARSDRRLREMHLGQWQGMSVEEVDSAWPGARLVWELDPQWAPPGGETRVEAAARAAQVVADLDATTYEVAVLCAHRCAIGALTARLLELPLVHWASLGGIGNCGWVVLERLGGGLPSVGDPWVLTAYNAGTERVDRPVEPHPLHLL
jgi:broad specificity phosphatase PhoE